MLAFCWMLTIIGVVFGALVLFGTFAAAKGAPQEAAGATLAVALVVLPTVFARACSELSALRQGPGRRVGARCCVRAGADPRRAATVN